MTDTAKFALKKPITDGAGNEIKELTLRAPNVGDFVKAEKFTGQVGYTAALVASVTGIALPVIYKLHPDDLNKIDVRLNKLLGNGEEEGSSPSGSEPDGSGSEPLSKPDGSTSPS